MDTQDEPLRAAFLNTARNLTSGERNRQHGDPFDNMTDIAELWHAYLSVVRRTSGGELVLQASHVAVMMQMVKMARMLRGSFNADDHIDNCGYAAIAGECAFKEQQ